MIEIGKRVIDMVVAAAMAGRLEVSLATVVKRRMESGDADSAGSTLRTIMVVIVVTAVVGAIGAAIRTAGGNAASCIVNAGC